MKASSKEAFTRMIDHWDHEALLEVVNDFLSNKSNAISKEFTEVHDWSFDKETNHILFYLDVEDPTLLQYKKDVANKLPGFQYHHKKCKWVSGSDGFAENKFRTWLEFTPCSNPIISSRQLILFLLSILLFGCAFYVLWHHWLNYDKPWKNLVSRFLEEYLTGLMYGGIGGAGVPGSSTTTNL